MTRMARIVVAEDHPEMLEDLCALLAPHFEIVDAVQDGAALVAAALRERPDVIVSDLSIPILDGIGAAKRILAEQPDARIVIVTAHSDPAIVGRCLEAGAIGWVAKMVAASKLVPAVHAALRGERLVALEAVADTVRREDP